MYGKEERKQTKREFWTTFGRLMKPHLSSEGMRVNWINYKTGIPVVQFSMDANQYGGEISIYIRHKDAEIRDLYWEQLLETKAYLHQLGNNEWTWDFDFVNRDGAMIPRVYLNLNEHSIFKKEDWPNMFAFFKQNIRILDEYWNDMKHLFAPLKD